MIKLLARFDIAVQFVTKKASKTEVVFVAARSSFFAERDSYDSPDFSIVQLADETFMPVLHKFRYLSSRLLHIFGTNCGVAT